MTINKYQGRTKEEAIEIATQLAFYCGWSKAWSTFPMIAEIWGEEEAIPNLAFPIGEPNTGFAQYFIGQSYLKPLTLEQVPTFNVTFEPGCRNNWHINHADKGGGQLLICVYGRGWYQEWGKEPRELHPGDVVNIPANVKHWHGRQRTAGSSISPRRFPEKILKPNGASRSMMNSTGVSNSTDAAKARI